MALDVTERPSPTDESHFSENNILRRDSDALHSLRDDGVSAKARQHLVQRLSRSQRILAARQAHNLVITYQPSLPVSKQICEIRQAITDAQVTVICGGTGSGKSTQIPKLCMELGYGSCGQIGHTQPRRIAARSVAQRLADETHSVLGSAIGSQVRFDKRVADESRLKVMTDGILLEEIRHDPMLLRYDALIVDEVHERSCNIDFALGYLARILPARPELKLVLMSATLDYQPLLRLFDAKLVEIPSNHFPITIDYLPADNETQSDVEAIDNALRILDADQQDVLVFLPGEREINDAVRYLNGRGFNNTVFVPLYGRMSVEAQSAVFKPCKQRRVILATNVAETSITIPGVRHVIDTGLARINRYNPRSKLQELQVAEISQASAKQRAGRCGREAVGRCLRLYSEENYAAREVYTTPEILRTNLASSILRCELLGLGGLESFSLPEPPSAKLIRDGINLLKEINAMDDSGAITPSGKLIGRLPVDPRLGRFLLAAAALGQGSQALIIVSALSVGDCRLRPFEKRAAADLAHQPFKAADSDLLFFINLWESLQETFPSLSHRRRRSYCEQHFLSYQRVEQWRDLNTQLAGQCAKLNIEIRSEDFSNKRLHEAFLSGFASFVGCKLPSGEYQGARGAKFRIHPNSALAKRKPKYVVCLEVVETSARFAQIVAKIDPAWVQNAVPSLIKRSYSAPDWDSVKGRAFAFETQRIFGITLRADKRVPYGAIDQKHSRELLVCNGLVQNGDRQGIEVINFNHSVITGLQRLEKKFRRMLAPSEREIVAHYDALIPGNVVTIKGLAAWLSQHPQFIEQLKLPAAGLLAELQRQASSEFPDLITVQEMRFNVRYLFDPTSPRDGMTIEVPVAVLDRLPVDAFEHLCPGYLHEKIVLLLKSLPKSLRKQVAPLAAFAREIVQMTGPMTLHEKFNSALATRALPALPQPPLNAVELPRHLMAHVQLFGLEPGEAQRANAGQRFFSSLSEAKAAYALQKNARLSTDSDDIYTRWHFKDLKRTKHTEVGVTRIVDYLALVDRGAGVSIDHFQTENLAAQAHLHGVARLATLTSHMGSKKRPLPGFEKKEQLLMLAGLGLSAKDILHLRKAAYASFLKLDELPYSSKEFDEFIKQNATDGESLAVELGLALAELIPEAFHVKQQLDNEVRTTWPVAATQLNAHWRSLLNATVFRHMRKEWLEKYPRYFRGMQKRIERIQLDPRKDALKTEMISKPLQLWDELWNLSPPHAAQMFDLRIALEEIILSQFAPELATRKGMSAKQLTIALREEIESTTNGT